MEPERVRAQLGRILKSGAFSDAGRASSFLRFVVGRALEGRISEIKETVIAIDVLGRNTSFDSKTDPIVRVEAARLRDRLRDYYDHDGFDDEVVISVPKGGYVPVFSERQQPAQSPTVDVLRVSLLPPDNAIVDSFVISPNGRRVAFTAYLSGTLMLWVRELDSLDAKPLSGTEGAAFPFWSPDNRSIGFFTPFKLKIIPASGGPCRDIADVVLGRGGSWNRDGIIVFCPRPVGILHQVSAAGGTPQPVTSLDTARAEISHGFPQFLPDERRFLYFAASYRSGELDPEVQYRRWGQACVSVSIDGLLLYRKGTIEKYQFTWIDRQGEQASIVGPRNSFPSSPHYSFSLSPDERRIAIHRPDDPDTALSTIWVMDVFRGGALWRLTVPEGSQPEFCPVWSNNAGELVFSRGDDRGMRLLRQALGSESPNCIVDTKGPKFPTDWSADRRFIAYNSQEPDYRYQHTWVAVTFSQDPPYSLLQHSHQEGSARFAPCLKEDAPRWMAYTSDETGRFEIYIRSFPDAGYKWQVSNEGGILPQWRSDGRELFYLAPDGTLIVVAVNPEAAEFGSPRRLLDSGLRLHSHSMWMSQYGVAKDGQRFLLNRPIEKSPAAITAVIPR